MAVIETAQRLADDVLYPAAPATDAAAVVPVELLDALADEGLYGLSVPAEAGGLGADFGTTCAVVEALASGCLTTTFVWAQHLGAARATSFSENEAMREWIQRLVRGECRAGLALGGALSGPARLTSTPSGEGWRFNGSSPFVSGWERIDVVHAAARTDDERLVWALVDAQASPNLSVERLRLAALDATNTHRADFREYFVPAERVTAIEPYDTGPTPPELLRFHASFPLGVAARCCRLLEPTPLAEEVAQCRARLDRLDPETIESDRASAAEIALRCASSLAVATGSRSILASDHGQRLVREALFTLVYALRPGSRHALLRWLASRS